MQKTVALHTLGCKLNYSETTAIGRLLENDGFVQKKFDEPADLYVINTCSVTENADKECRQLVRRVQRQSPEAMVVITGCYAQLKPKEISEIPGVNLVLGAAEKFNIVNHLRDISAGDPAKICSCDVEDVNTFIPSHSKHERTRVFLKVQDGCDYTCSFCTIPQARGRSRSNRIEHVIADVNAIAESGAKEIVLTGINLGDFGKGLNGGKQKQVRFLDLVKALETETDIQRFRISSIEPNLLDDKIIDRVAVSNKFMPHFHIPLQSGSDKILGLMRRRYKTDLYADKVSRIKSAMPHASIGVDVINGFPGEDEAAFNETMQFLTDLDISYLHVFTYSERDNTHALLLKPVVPKHVRQDRTKTLRTLSYRKQQDFTRKHIGQSRRVLFESENKNGLMEGYSDNYIRVTAPFDARVVNEIVDWVI